MSKIKKQAHVAEAKHGMGDFYGSGVRNKVGRIRDTSTPGAVPVSKKGLRKPPRSLA